MLSWSQNGTLYLPGSRMENGKEKKRGKGKGGGGEEEKEPSRHELSVKEASQNLSSTLSTQIPLARTHYTATPGAGQVGKSRPRSGHLLAQLNIPLA